MPRWIDSSALLTACSLLAVAALPARAQPAAPQCLAAGRESSTDPDSHLQWAAAQTEMDLSLEMKRKIKQLADCPALDDAHWLGLFAALSVSTARSEPDVGCYGGDTDAISTDPGAQRTWARGTGRGPAAANLQWRTASALACLAPQAQQRLYADLSATLARAGGAVNRAAEAGNPAAAETPRPLPGGSAATPLAGVWRVQWRDQNTISEERWEIVPANTGGWLVRHTLLGTNQQFLRGMIGKTANDIALHETGPGRFKLEQTGGDPNPSDLSHFEQTGEGRCNGDTFTLEGRHKSVARFYPFKAAGRREQRTVGASP